MQTQIFSIKCRQYFQGIFILASVLFVLYPHGLAVRRLQRMQEVVGSKPTEDKFDFHILLY